MTAYKKEAQQPKRRGGSIVTGGGSYIAEVLLVCIQQ